MNRWYLVSFFVGLAACSATTDDTLYLTGTEEFPVRTVDGEYVCPTPKKELICHIPPGNPDNAHTICVSRHAVETHQEHHGDLVGPCEGGGDDGEGDVDAGGGEVEVDAGDGNGGVDAPPEEVPIIN